MLLAMLDFFDFVIIGVLIALYAGGSSIASSRSAATAAAGERLRRIEDKLNLLLSANGIKYVPSAKEQWQRLADDNNIQDAAQEYHAAHSVPLAEAEDVVQQYVADSQQGC